MGATKTYYLMIQEQEYYTIPEPIRETFLSSKIYRESDDDIEELLQNEEYSKMYHEKRNLTKAMDELKYKIRETKRKQLNK